MPSAIDKCHLHIWHAIEMASTNSRIDPGQKSMTEHQFQVWAFWFMSIEARDPSRFPWLRKMAEHNWLPFETSRKQQTLRPLEINFSHCPASALEGQILLIFQIKHPHPCLQKNSEQTQHHCSIPSLAKMMIAVRYVYKSSKDNIQETQQKREWRKTYDPGYKSRRLTISGMPGKWKRGSMRVMSMIGPRWASPPLGTTIWKWYWWMAADEVLCG